MRGKKSDPHPNPSDPPRRRANKRKGRGTYANDRPPILGTVGRESGQVRLRVAHRTDTETLSAHVHQFTQGKAIVDSIASIPPFVMASDNGQPMLMEMGFERFTLTPLKAFGRLFATSYARFGGFTRSFLPAILPYVSFALTQKSSHRRLSQNSSIARFLNMSH